MAVKNWETTANGRSAVPSKSAGSFNTLETVAKKPSKPTSTAPCIKCFRKFSLLLLKNPKSVKITPNIAGIKAVQTCPIVIPGLSVATA